MDSFILMLCIAVMLSHLAAGSDLYKPYEAEIENAPLTKIATDEENGEIFVGGTNIFLHLNSDLTINNLISLGPVNDSQECPPKSHVCIFNSKNKSVETDDIVRILVYNKRRRHLIICGSAHQGMCFLYDPVWRVRKFFKNPGNDSYIGGKNATVIVYSSQKTYYDEEIYFVAQSYDGRNMDFFHKEFSKLSLNLHNGNFHLQKAAAYANLEVCSNWKTSFHFRFIYAFESGNYIYFIYVRSKKNEAMYETKIAQICRTDQKLNSFVEFSLQCSRHGNKTYTMASSAYFQSHADDTKAMLYVTFGLNTYRTGHLEDSIEGSVLCSYSLKDIKRIVRTTLLNCFAAEDGHEPEWTCSNSSHFLNKECSSPGPGKTIADYCGFQGFNMKGIQAPSRVKLTKTSKYNSPTSELLTSVAYHEHQHSDNRTESVIILGTNTGYLIKVSQTAGHTQYAKFKLSDEMIQPDTVFDNDYRNIYLLSGRKVYKFNLYSCKVHATCDQCVTTSDPLGCGWCGDHCSTMDSCNGVWYNNTCPPIISSVSPLSGSVAGGTSITIGGQYFGSNDASREVYLHGANTTLSCEIQTANDNNITCKTRNSTGGGSYDIVVNVNDTSRQVYPLLDIRGNSEKQEFNFTYYVPKIVDIKPLYGPKMGNTSVTITGSYLDIGSSRTVEVAGFPCKIKRYGYDKIICRTDRWINIIQRKARKQQQTNSLNCETFAGPVVIQIDEGKVETARDLNYCYMGDPSITDIFPHKTIKSGGVSLTVEGQNFRSMTQHEMFIKFENDEVVDQKAKCKVAQNGNRMICPFPSFNGSIPASQDIEGRIVIALDGMEHFLDTYRSKKFITYFPDPTFDHISDEMTIYAASGEHLLELKGQNLNLVLTKDDFNVSINNVRCPVKILNETYLSCVIDRDIVRNSTTNKQYNRVVVKAGNLFFVLGRIIFSHVRSGNLKGEKDEIDGVGEKSKVFGIVGGIVACVAFSLVIFILIMVKKYRPYRRKVLNIDNNLDVYANERSISSIVPPSSIFDERDDNQRPRTNDSRYVRYGNNTESRQPLLSEGATGGESNLSSIEHATVILLEKQNLLIDRNYLVLGENLGHGEFGCVYKGYLSRPGEKGETLVAVKTILRSGYGSNVNEFLNEALMMKDFNHPNVLRLIGISLEEGEFPLVIIPFMKLGDLLSYIRNEENNPTVKELVSFGIDIAQGMEYLSGIKYVHRDLAARNCMLDEHKTVKVADFGLSRDIYSKEYYSCDNKRKLPVKWMAPESLEKGTYTSKSDVWSYGIVLWELLTRGASPYPGVENWDVARYIKMGRRLPRPEYCPESLFVTMTKCWEYNPGQRPTFKELLDEVMDIVLTKGQDSRVTDIPVDLEKCTNYDYGDQNVPDWATNLRVNLPSSPSDLQVSWTNGRTDTVNIMPSANMTHVYSQSAKSKRIDSARFRPDNDSVNFMGSVETKPFSVTYTNAGLQNNSEVQNFSEDTENSPMLLNQSSSTNDDDNVCVEVNMINDGYMSVNECVKKDESQEDADLLQCTNVAATIESSEQDDICSDQINKPNLDLQIEDNQDEEMQQTNNVNLEQINEQI